MAIDCSERKSQIINIPKFIIMWERMEIIEASIKFKNEKNQNKPKKKRNSNINFIE